MAITRTRLDSSFPHSITTIDFLTHTSKVCTLIVSAKSSSSSRTFSACPPPSTRSTPPQSKTRRTAASWGHSLRMTYQTISSIQHLRCPLQLYLCLPCVVTSTVLLGESIASKWNIEYTYAGDSVPTSSVGPIPGAVIGTWETDDEGEQHSISSVSSLLTAVIRLLPPHSAGTKLGTPYAPRPTVEYFEDG